MFSVLLVSATALYGLLVIVLLIGLRRAGRYSMMNSDEPTVSVIVAARNEEHCIEDCLRSLSELNYPPEKLQVIIVNDNSQDKTKEIVSEFMRSHSTCTLISAMPGKGNLYGKTNALAQGIHYSSGEILMFTDADCTVPKQWVKETVRSFEPSVGIVGGFTLLPFRSMFEGVQALDWIFLFDIASATAGLNMPLTVIGNNFSVRRSAYDAVGGYEQIPFSVTEDYALVQAIVTRTNYTVRFPVRLETLVHSRPCENLLQLYRQKQRWGVGGLDMVFRGMLIMSIGWLLRFTLLLAAFTVPFSLFAFSCFSICLLDMRLLWKPLRTFNARRALKYLLLFEVYYIVYVTVIPFIAFFSRNVVWKERSL